MNKKQQSAYDMHLRVLAFSKKNRALLGAFIVLDNLISRLENSISKIDAQRVKQEINISGVSIQKGSLRTFARRKALEVSQGILAYTETSGNEILAKEAYYTETELKRDSDKELGTALSIIYKAAERNQAVLLNYGLNEEKIIALRSAIDAYKISVGTPKDVRIARKQATNKLDLGLSENAGIVKKIDLLMGTIKYTDPELYAGYKNNRKVFRRSRSLRAKVAVTDSRTARGLAGVRILFRLDEELKLDKKSAAGGGLIIKSLEEGVYNVSLSKIGYKSQYLSVNILKSEYVRINVALEKEEEE